MRVWQCLAECTRRSGLHSAVRACTLSLTERVLVHSPRPNVHSPRHLVKFMNQLHALSVPWFIITNTHMVPCLSATKAIRIDSCIATRPSNCSGRRSCDVTATRVHTRTVPCRRKRNLHEGRVCAWQCLLPERLGWCLTLTHCV